MDSLLAHPAIQGGVLPFIIAFVISLVFFRVNLLAGLAIVAGFAVMVQLTTGFSFSPMTSTRKIILLILIAPAIAFIFQLWYKNLEGLSKIGALFAAIALLWVLWPVLMRAPVSDIFFPALSYVIYAAWMMMIFMRMAELPAVTAGTASMMTGFTIGGAALIGASALLGQMGMVLAATGAGFLLVQLLTKSEEAAGLSFTMSSGLLAALLLPAAIVYAKVPWLVLPIAALIPLIAIYPFADDEPSWQDTSILLLFISPLVALALYLTWESAGALLM